MTRSELFAKVYAAKTAYLRHVGVLLAQALDAPGSDAGLRNAGSIEWREPIHVAERIKEHKRRNGCTLKEAAAVIVP